MKLAENIRAYRRARSLTQEQLAEVLDVTGGKIGDNFLLTANKTDCNQNEQYKHLLCNNNEILSHKSFFSLKLIAIILAQLQEVFK